MKENLTYYTVKQLADLAGVSIRTLHYYDEIGLLPPALVEDNGYRRYDQNSVLTLQQILFYRELGMNLKEIAEVITQPEFEIVQALQSHKLKLGRKARRLEQLIDTVENTIRHLEGELEMSKEELFCGFSEEQQKEYAKEAEKLYDPRLAHQSQERWESYTQEQKDAVRAEGEAIHLAILDRMDEGAESPLVQEQVAALHRHFVSSYYDCTFEIFRGLGQMWVDDPRFNQVYEKIKPGFALFLREAVMVYTEGKSGLPEM
ncbi:MAG: MerR family transcriptional regulator [Chloroflexota bacterium]